MAQWLTNPTRNHGVAVRSLASLSGLRIHCCRELGYGSHLSNWMNLEDPSAHDSHFYEYDFANPLSTKKHLSIIHL